MKKEDTEKETKELLSDIINNNEENFFTKDYVLDAIIFKKNGEKVLFSIDNLLEEKIKIKTKSQYGNNKFFIINERLAEIVRLVWLLLHLLVW